MRKKRIIISLLVLLLMSAISFVPVEAAVYTGEHWDTSGQGGSPTGITTNGTHILISDNVDKEVYIYNMAGVYIDSFDTSSQSDNPYGIATNGTHIWIVDLVVDEVYIYTMAGVYTNEHWDTSGHGNNPYGIATDGTNIWIVDPFATQVYKYTMVGIYVDSWDTSVQSFWPYGITTDGTNIWIVDDASNEVYKYDMAGTYIYSFDTSGHGDYPYGVATDGSYIWVVDRADDEVYKYSYIINEAPTAPTFNSPANNSKFEPAENLNISWAFNDPDDGDNQSAYRFQLSTSTDFSTTINDTYKVSSSNEYHQGVFPEQLEVYYVRVKTWDESNIEGPWSSTLFIEVAPAESSPGWPSIPGIPSIPDIPGLPGGGDGAVAPVSTYVNLGIFFIVGAVAFALFWKEAGDRNNKALKKFQSRRDGSQRTSKEKEKQVPKAFKGRRK